MGGWTLRRFPISLSTSSTNGGLVAYTDKLAENMALKEDPLEHDLPPFPSLASLSGFFARPEMRLLESSAKGEVFA